MKVLITGADGFVGKNFQLRLRERNDIQVICYTRNNQSIEFKDLLHGVDFVFHFAGINRSENPDEFIFGNVDLTKELCVAVAEESRSSGKTITTVFSSSVQTNQENPYGLSKLKAEIFLEDLKKNPLTPVYIFRLPNIFGKWGKPNYNSAVATFCHNIARDLPIKINDPNALIRLVYIDDLIDSLLHILDGKLPLLDIDGYPEVQPQYKISVGELANIIQKFRDSRKTLITERVGTGLIRALYSSYMSYLPAESFAYDVPQHSDSRGKFVELLKTPDCGQFSFFTAHPGVTRGGHYHHSKTEKFLVIKGKALFCFRHMHTGETHELEVSEETSQIVETIPGWTHDITNIGDDEMIVMLWANEIFDRSSPDTYSCPL